MSVAQVPVIAVKQFLYAAGARDEHIFSYLLYDGATGESLLVDELPELAQDYSDFLARKNLKSPKKFSTSAGAAEEQIALGSTRLVVVKTPGINPGSTCLLGPGMIFTGGTLWTGTRVPQLGAQSNVEDLFRSLARLKEKLSPETLVFPGFNSEDRAFSLWRVELEKNPDLAAKSPAALKESKAKDWDPETPSFAQISAEKLLHKFPLEKSLLIDVRDPEEFAVGHIPGSTNIPLSDLPFRLDELRRVPRTYVYCLSGQRSHRAAIALSYLGFNDVVLLTGGMKSWQNAGLEIKK